jgi:hypothetical protein
MTDQEQIDAYLAKNETPMYQKFAQGKGSVSNKASHRVIKNEETQRKGRLTKTS